MECNNPFPILENIDKQTDRCGGPTNQQTDMWVHRGVTLLIISCETSTAPVRMTDHGRILTLYEEGGGGRS